MSHDSGFLNQNTQANIWTHQHMLAGFQAGDIDNVRGSNVVGVLTIKLAYVSAHHMQRARQQIR